MGKKKLKTRYTCYYCKKEIISPDCKQEKNQLDLFGVPLKKKWRIGHHIRYDTGYVVNVCTDCHNQIKKVSRALGGIHKLRTLTQKWDNEMIV